MLSVSWCSDVGFVGCGRNRRVKQNVRGLFRRHPTVSGRIGWLCGVLLGFRLLCGLFGCGIAFDFIGGV